MAVPDWTEWVFDLAQTAHPIRRIGIHGLCQALYYGEGNPRYPGVKQTDHLQWSMGDTAVRIQFKGPEGIAGLNGLMSSHVGDFRDGIAIPPGYPDDPSQKGFYATVRAHQAITFARFGRRSLSLSSQANASRRRKWIEEHGRTPIEEVASAFRMVDGELEPFSKKVTAHQWNPVLSLEQTAKKKTLRRFQEQGGKALHPSLSKWNDFGAKLTPEDKFLLTFSCLGYVYSWLKEGGCIGLGLDLPTFPEAREYHDIWCCTEPKILFTIPGSEHTAFWLIATILGLPDRPYPTLSDRQVGMFRPSVESYETEFLYRVLHKGLTNADKSKMLYRVRSVPVRVYETSADDKPSKVITLQDIVLRNLEHGQHWSLGLDACAFLVRKKPGSKKKGSEGLYKSEALDATEIINALTSEDPVEKAVMTRMNWMFGHLVRYYATRKSATNPNWDKGRLLARQHAVRIHLNRATTFTGVIDALNAIRDKAPSVPDGKGGNKSCPWFSDAELQWILDHKDEPYLLRSLLTFACEGWKPDRNGNGNGAEKSPGAEDDNDEAIGDADGRHVPLVPGVEEESG